jgi:hypothetical protein
MEYLLFFIMLGGVFSFIKHPIAGLKITGFMLLLLILGAGFGFSADYLEFSQGWIVFTSLFGAFASFSLIVYFISYQE